MAIKRNPALVSFSKDHHHALLLCWKIKVGFKKGVSAERIKKYSDWFYKNHILVHFQLEEQYIFPVLGNENKLTVQALNEHREILRLFNDRSEIEESLKKLEILLTQHIRFEEQVLFNEIQKNATEAQLKKIEEIHSNHQFEENESDLFWK